jgi:hypothetical protein
MQERENPSQSADGTVTNEINEPLENNVLADVPALISIDTKNMEMVPPAEHKNSYSRRGRRPSPD